MSKRVYKPEVQYRLTAIVDDEEVFEDTYPTLDMLEEELRKAEKTVIHTIRLNRELDEEDDD